MKDQRPPLIRYIPTGINSPLKLKEKIDFSNRQRAAIILQVRQNTKYQKYDLFIEEASGLVDNFIFYIFRLLNIKDC